MNTFLQALFVLAASALSAPSLAAAPVPITNYLGPWTVTAVPYTAGIVVTYDNKTWLSLIDDNNAIPGVKGSGSKWRMLGPTNSFAYKLGDRGPGGGWIFFVDKADEFPGFTYLEAAPEDVGNPSWCDQAGVSIPKARNLAVGQGQANTQAMLAVCAWGAANSATAYRGPNNKSDWFLPSLSELRLLSKWYAEQEKGDLLYEGYWSSSEYISDTAWYEQFNYDNRDNGDKDTALRVRPIRAF